MASRGQSRPCRPEAPALPVVFLDTSGRGNAARRRQSTNKPSSTSQVSATLSCDQVTLAGLYGNQRLQPLRYAKRDVDLIQTLATSPTGRRLQKTFDLRNNENLVGPRILHLGAGYVTAHIDVPSTGIKRAEHITRLIRHCFCSWKFRLGGGTSR